MLETGERNQLAGSNTTLSAAEVTSVFNSIKRARASDVGRYGRTAANWLSQRLADGQIRGRIDADDWNRALLQATGSDAIQIVSDSIPEDVGHQIRDEAFERIQPTMERNAGESAESWLKWGLVLNMKLSRLPEAEVAYRKAVALAPDWSLPWAALGNFLLKYQSRYSAAADAYRSAMERQPTTSMAWIGLAAVLQEHLGRFEEAETILREALALDLEPIAARILLADLLQIHLRGYTESEDLYRKVIELDSTSAWPWAGLANLQRNQGNLAEAEISYRRAISSNPNLASVWNDFGNFLCDYLNRYEDADTAYRNSLALNPNNEVPLQNLISMRRDFIGDVEDALLLMKDMRRVPNHRFPDTTNLHEMLFAAYEHNWGSARDWLREAIEHRVNGFWPGNIDDWCRASAVLLHLNYGAELLAFLDQQGDTVAKLRPWVDALKAHVAGGRRYLQNIAPEIRTTAEVFYDGIDRRLQKLPEKTRRRPLPKPKRQRSSALL